MKRFWIRRAGLFLLAGLAFATLAGGAVMVLWNALMPAIFGLPALTFWQALGLLVLTRLLVGVGGRGWGGGGPRRAAWKEKMAERWAQLTPEQRQQLRRQWRRGCGPPDPDQALGPDGPPTQPTTR